MTNKLTILSLGWGVQSWTLAAMAALGELPKPDFAVHSDTTFEMAHTYAFAEQWTPWLEAHGIPVVTVRDTRATHILKKSSTSEGHYTLMPVFTLNNGERGQLRRQCTSRWKIEPLHKWLGEELTRRGIAKAEGVVEQWLGISLDEWQRMKQSPVSWIENTYPLIDRRQTRDDCLRWLGSHNLPSPGKSACRQCPYRAPNWWKEMARQGGEDWDAAVAADEALRASGRPWFIHPARVPLAEAVQDSGQARMFDDEVDPSCDSGHCFL